MTKAMARSAMVLTTALNMAWRVGAFRRTSYTRAARGAMGNAVEARCQGRGNTREIITCGAERRLLIGTGTPDYHAPFDHPSFRTENVGLGRQPVGTWFHRSRRQGRRSRDNQG